MSHSTARRRCRQIELLRSQFAQADGLAFAEVLSVGRVERALQEEGATWREQSWTPLVTLWAFLGQVIGSGPTASCATAVSRVLAWLVSCGATPCPAVTGPYCKARQRLPESLVRRLTRETGQSLSQATPKPWLWHGRRVKIADGTTVSMPDTVANQAAYPQMRSQQPGVGFPIARMTVVFCLACGTVIDAALGQYRGKKTGENALLRTLDEAFEPGDVLLCDRYFGGYFDIAHWQRRGVDVVVRLHQLRTCDLRRGRRLGPNDHVVTWSKPHPRPQWLDEATDARLPQSMELREVRVQITIAGFRTETVVVVTTLLDDQTYSASALADLYRLRWRAELDLRSLKSVLDMDVLRCKSPEMVRKELWAHLLAYNLIRTVMAQAADRHGRNPRRLSFTATLQTMTSFAERILDADPDRADELHAQLLVAVATHRVGHRPNRAEPRAVKRRPKPHPLLTQPRDVVRKQLRQMT